MSSIVAYTDIESNIEPNIVIGGITQRLKTVRKTTLTHKIQQANKDSTVTTIVSMRHQNKPQVIK